MSREGPVEIAPSCYRLHEKLPGNCLGIVIATEIIEAVCGDLKLRNRTKGHEATLNFPLGEHKKHNSLKWLLYCDA